LTDELRQKTDSWVIIALMPELDPPGGSSIKNTDRYKQFKDNLYHQCLELVMKPLVEAEELGGFYLRGARMFATM
jgi:hypothetical protein